MGAALAEPGTPANEFVRAIQTVWDDLDSGFVGDHYLIPKQGRGLAPIQRPHLPIQLVAFAPAAVQPPAQLLRGGAPLSMSLSSEEMADAWVGVAGSTKQFTGSPEIVVRALVRLTEGPIGESRTMFTGSRDQLRTTTSRLSTRSVWTNCSSTSARCRPVTRLPTCSMSPESSGSCASGHAFRSNCLRPGWRRGVKRYQRFTRGRHGLSVHPPVRTNVLTIAFSCQDTSTAAA